MGDFPVQTYDLVMLLILVGAAAFGAWKGMAWQLASLASVVVSAAVAIHLSPWLAPRLSGSEPWNRVLAMLILYVACALAIWLGFRAVSSAIERVRLREFDRQAGAVFGLAKGALLCLVVTFFAVTLSETSRRAVLGSRSGKLIARVTCHANHVLPDELRQVVGKYVDELDERLHDGLDEAHQTSHPAPSEAPDETVGLGGSEGQGGSFGESLERAVNSLEEATRRAGEVIDAVEGRGRGVTAGGSPGGSDPTAEAAIRPNQPTSPAVQ